MPYIVYQLVVIALVDLTSQSLGTPHTVPPLICRTGRRNTTGPYANTVYDVIAMSDCSSQRFPQYNCTIAPGSPSNVAWNGTGFSFGAHWHSNYKEGSDVSILKGFKVKISIEPTNSTPLPWKCFYVNITDTRNNQPVMGLFYIQCTYGEQSGIRMDIMSYPTPDMCPKGSGVSPKPVRLAFYIPLLKVASTTPAVRTLLPTTTSAPITPVVIVTALSCSLLFVIILIAVICALKGPCKDKRFPRPPFSLLPCLQTNSVGSDEPNKSTELTDPNFTKDVCQDTNVQSCESEGNNESRNIELTATQQVSWKDFTKRINSLP